MTMTKEMRKAIHDIIARVLKLEGKRVIWRNQDGIKIANPVVTLFVYSKQAQAMAEFRQGSEEGTKAVYVPTDAVLEVQMFDQRGEFPSDKLEYLVRCLELPDVVEECTKAGIVFFDSEPVQDVTVLLPNSQQYEPRAAVDLHIRYAEVMTANVGAIEEVGINGTVGERTLSFSVPDVDNE